MTADSDDSADEDDDDPADPEDPEDELEALGVGHEHVDGLDPDEIDDFLNDVRRAASPASTALQCVAVHPRLDDVTTAAFGGLGVDELAAARGAITPGYFIAVDLEDGRIAVLYTSSSPTDPAFRDQLYAADDNARELSRLADVVEVGDVSGDDGVQRAKSCL